MSKYSNEFKLEIIKYYLEGYHSYSKCIKKFNISSDAIINKWIHKYEEYGVERIIKHLKSSYDGNFNKT